MPRKNIIKPYLSDAYYHLYNRSPQEITLFHQEADFRVYKRYFNQACVEFAGELEVFVATLLPNHFHILVWQKNERTITQFMRKLHSRYASYYRLKYEHKGTIFEGSYRARRLKTEAEVREIYRYIRKNPLEAGYPNWPYLWGKGIELLEFFLKRDGP